MSSSIPTPDDTILRMAAVKARTGLSRSMIYRKMNERTFPAGIKLSGRAVGWYESQIRRWMANPTAYQFDPEAM